MELLIVSAIIGTLATVVGFEVRRLVLRGKADALAVPPAEAPTSAAASAKAAPGPKRPAVGATGSFRPAH